jgi:hypothetical protein
MNDVVFVSTAFGDIRYLHQMDKLRRSIENIYPKANIMFWHDCLPPGAKPFLDSLYGFKVHAIHEARKKFKKVIWLDPAMKLRDKVDDLIKQPTVIAIKDDSVLHNVVSDKCYQYFGLTRDFVKNKDWHLVGGSLYFFNFNHPTANAIFDIWYRAEHVGIFGSQHEASFAGLQGHRYDETVMAISMDMNGVEPVGHDYVRYCIQDNPLWGKLHFK